MINKLIMSLCQRGQHQTFLPTQSSHSVTYRKHQYILSKRELMETSSLISADLVSVAPVLYQHGSALLS